MNAELPWSSADRIQRRLCSDAVVVVPGIMGSALYDTEAERTIWGLRPAWYARAWSLAGPGMTALAVTEDELAGRSRRVRPIGLLEFPAFLPILRGLEPYTRLVRTIEHLVPDKAAVRTFAYDWRLSVRYNAVLLADAVQQHLARWRAGPGGRAARAVVVAHSMGGLLCQAMAAIPGAMEGIRSVITLGTPFDGAAAAAVILSSGSGALLPARRLRAVAVTMPGIHDLLPRYRCVHEDNNARLLTVDDIRGMGANPDLARQAFEDHRVRMSVRLPDHHALVGVEQPTLCSLSLADGVATGMSYTFDMSDGELLREPNGRLVRFAGLGDGTVPRNSSLPGHQVRPMPLAQQHTTLAQSDEARTFVRQVLLHGVAESGSRLGDGDVGLTLPDLVRPGEEWVARLTGVEPHHATCTVSDADTNQEILHLDARPGERTAEVAIILPAPGLYRVRVDGGSTPVTQYVLAVDDTR